MGDQHLLSANVGQKTYWGTHQVRSGESRGRGRAQEVVLAERGG